MHFHNVAWVSVACLSVSVRNKWWFDCRCCRRAMRSAGCCRKYQLHQCMVSRHSRNSSTTSSTHVTVSCDTSACLTRIMWALVAWRPLRYADASSMPCCFDHWSVVLTVENAIAISYNCCVTIVDLWQVAVLHQRCFYKVGQNYTPTVNTSHWIRALYYPV